MKSDTANLEYLEKLLDGKPAHLDHELALAFHNFFKYLEILKSQMKGYFHYGGHKCIYFLINDDEIVYVGMTKQIITRIHDHINMGKIFNCVRYILIPEELHKNTVKFETAFIRLLDPKYNRYRIPKKQDRQKYINTINELIGHPRFNGEHLHGFTDSISHSIW